MALDPVNLGSGAIANLAFHKVYRVGELAKRFTVKAIALYDA